MSLLITFIFIYCVFLCKVNDYMFLLGWILTLVNLYLLNKRKRLELNSIDFLILCYLIYDFISIFTGYNKIPAFINFINTYTIITFYFICRLCINTVDKAKNVILYVTLFCSILPLFNIVPFYRQFNSLEQLQFNAFISDFKFVFTPLGMSINAWSTFLIYIFLLQNLCLFLYKKNTKYFIYVSFGFASSLFLLINSFTRGVYLCLIVYFISTSIILIKGKFSKVQKNYFAFFLIALIGLSSSVFTEDIIKTIKLTETTSQQRSLIGRLSSAHKSIEIFSQSPLTGVGSGNFSFAENFYEKGNDTVTSFSGNTLFQLLAEKGVFGCVLVCCLLISIFMNLLKYRGKLGVEKYIFISFLIILIVREMTFPSILSNSACQSLLFFFIAIMQCYFPLGQCQYSLIRRFCFISFLFVIPTCATISWYLYRNNQDSIYIDKYMGAIEKSNLFESKFYIEKASQGIVPNINRSILYWNLYKEYSTRNFLLKAKDVIISSIKQSPNDYVLFHNLAKVYEAEGEITKSDSIMDLLIKRYPEKALFKLINVVRNKKSKNELVDILIKNPRMVKTEYFNSLISENRICERDIKEGIKRQCIAIESTKDPILYAKYGKLLLMIGDTLLAKKILESSIGILPNLIEPRYNLSIIEHYRGNEKMATLYADQYKALTRKPIEERVNDVCIDEAYYTNFQWWYGGKIPPKEVLFYK
ncbi:O-antigen ligase family protein [Bacteroides nordii]|uniref:O-antigen ligase family protein n=1 Tax=Bacteroides nordii TaxID=291645 RepID=UPI00399A5A5C